MPISKDTYRIDFAPDEKHYQVIKQGKIERLWNDFCFNADYIIHCSINRFAKFRLINTNTGRIIGILPRKEE